MGYGSREAHGNGWVLFFFQYQSANRHRYGHIISGVYALLLLYSLLSTIYLSISTWLIS